MPRWRYALREPMGRGATAEVWAAHDRELDVPVAVKLFRPTAVADPWAEVRAAARLVHPSVALVVDFGRLDAATAAATGQDEGTPFLVMEYAHGGSLEGRRLPWLEVREVMAQVLDGLAWAHAAGLVHRDLKPANVLADDPRDARRGARITDFGLALLDDEGEENRVWGGTPGFLAPEQARGAPVGPAADLYAAGRTLLALLSGDTRVPAGLEAWLGWCLARQPEQRFACAADAHAALDALGPAAVPAPDEGFEPAGSSTPTFVFDAVLPEPESAVPTDVSLPPAPRGCAPSAAGRLPEEALGRRLLFGSRSLLPLRRLPPLAREETLDALCSDLEVWVGQPGITTLRVGADEADAIVLWLAMVLRARGVATVVDLRGERPASGVRAALGIDPDARLDALLAAQPPSVRTAGAAWLSGERRRGPVGAVLRALGRERPVLAVVAARDEVPRGVHSLVLGPDADGPALAPLDPVALARVLADERGLARSVADALAHRAAGRPALADRWLRETAAGVPEPDARARPARWSEDLEGAVGALAIVRFAPRALTLRVWAELGLEADVVLGALEERGVVDVVDDVVRFTHPDHASAAPPDGALQAWLDAWDAPDLDKVRWCVAAGRPERAAAWTATLFEYTMAGTAEALRICRALLEQRPDPALALQADLLEAGRVETPEPWLRRADAVGRPVASWVRARVGAFLFRQGRTREAVEVSEGALALGGSAETRARALCTIGWSRIGLGQPADALAPLRGALDGPPTHSDFRARAGIAAAQLELDRVDEAEQTLRAARAAAADAGIPAEVARCTGNLADVLRIAGREEEALALVEDSIRLREALDLATWNTTALAGYLLLRQGREVEAYHRLAPTLADARSLAAPVHVLRLLAFRLPGKVALDACEDDVLTDLEELTGLAADLPREDTVAERLEALVPQLRARGFERAVAALEGLEWRDVGRAG